MASTVSYQGHRDGHRLSVIEEGPPNPSILPRCARCSLEISAAPYFCCPTCDDFHLHLHCGPLPLTISSRYHHHPLELADTVVEDDSGEYYCEICEEERDPRDCVYYCPPCLFICHLKCVYAEVASMLKGGNGEVELRTVGDRIPGRVVAEDTKGKAGADSPRGGYREEGGRTLKEVFRSLSEDELRELRDLCPRDEQEDSTPSPEASQGVVKEVIPYTDEDFRRLLRDLDSTAVSWETLLGFFDMDLRVAPVQGQEVPAKFADTWGQLMNKYGKFYVGSDLSEQIKIFVVTLLCDVVHEMSMTGLNDVTEEKLRSWWKKLRVVLCGGFKVKFVVDHLKKVVSAHFGREATRFAVMKAEEVGEEAARVEEEIRSLEEKLRELNDQRQEYKSRLDTSKSRVMKRCLEEASAFGLSKASKGLIP